MCSFYWSHRLGPLQPVIRLQVLYPLVLALPHPHPLVHRPVRGSLPHAPADVSTGEPLPTSLRLSAVCFSLCGLAALVIVPIHRLCALSIPVISKHSRVTTNLIPRWERWANCALKRWMIPDRLWGLSSDPLLPPPPLQASLPSLLHAQIALRELSAGPLWLSAAVELPQKPPKIPLTPIMRPVFAFQRIWAHRVQIVFKLSESQCQIPLTSFLWNGRPEIWK